jgi:tetratricopeptide (TPR) repeat protein
MHFLLALFLLQDPSAAAKQAMTQGRFAEAAKLYRQLATQYPNEPLLRFNLALAQYSARQYPAAITTFRTFLKAQPAHPQANLLLASSLVKIQKGCEALPAIAQAKPLLGASPEYLAIAGQANFDCLDYAAAAQHFEQLTRLAPRNAQGWYGLGKARVELQDHPGAQAAFANLSALPFSPELRQLELDIARGLLRNNQVAEAKQAYARLLTVHPEDAAAEYELGGLIEKESGAEAALANYERATKYQPEFLEAQGAYGRALLAAGRGPEAIAPLEKAARANLDKSLWAALANAYRAAGRDADARRALLRAR